MKANERQQDHPGHPCPEETAIALVMERWSRLLWKVAADVLSGGDDREIEECVADAFVWLWQHPEAFDPGRGKLKTLLCLKTRSLAIDRLRALSRRGEEFLSEGVPAPGWDMEKRLEAEERRKTVSEAVASLPQPDRKILIRRYYYQQKPGDIARALDLPVKKVENRLYRSKLRLRERLGEH